MSRINMHIFKVKLPFYPLYEIKCGLRNRVSTVGRLINEYLMARKQKAKRKKRDSVKGR